MKKIIKFSLAFIGFFPLSGFAQITGGGATIGPISAAQQGGGVGGGTTPDSLVAGGTVSGGGTDAAMKIPRGRIDLLDQHASGGHTGSGPAGKRFEDTAQRLDSSKIRCARFTGGQDGTGPLGILKNASF